MDSNKQLIEDSFKELFKRDEEFISILSGDWGIGKTYFWNELSQKLTCTDKQVYISLFGLDSIQAIKTDILFKISKFKKSANWLNKNITSRLRSLKTVLKLDDDVSIPLNMEVISSLFSLLSQGDFKDIVICFDDVERISNKIDFKDFMGFLSELKEKNKCKVLIILNENELNNLSSIDQKPYGEIFSLYKEKIVDFEFHYKPNVEECFTIANGLVDIKFFDKNSIFEFFNKKGIKNIRVIKQCLYYINQFSFVLDLNLDDRIVKDFIQSALTVFSFKSIYNLSEDKFKKFKEYKRKKNSFIVQQSINKQFDLKKDDEKETFHEIEEFEKCLKDHSSGVHWDDLEEILYNYLYTLAKNKDKIKDFLNEKNENTYRLDIQEELLKIEDESIYCLNLNDVTQNKRLIEILNESKQILSKIFSLEDFSKIIDMLDISKYELKDKLKQELLENFIKNVLDTQDNEKNHRRNDNEKLIFTYPHLKNYIDNYRSTYKLNSDLYSFIKKTIYHDKAFLTKKDEILIERYKSDIKLEMINSSEFFKLITQVINSHTRDSNINTLKEILVELKNDEKYRPRIELLEKKHLVWDLESHE